MRALGWEADTLVKAGLWSEGGVGVGARAVIWAEPEGGAEGEAVGGEGGDLGEGTLTSRLAMGG